VGIKTAQAIPRVSPPRAVIHSLGHRLAELAIARDIDSEIVLAAYNFGHRRRQLLRQRAFVVCLPCSDQSVGARQAAGMAGQDVV
jgi:hypothetical protein